VHAPVARAAGADALPTPLAKPAISAAEQAFMDGWSALRQGRHQAAADSFARAAALSAGTPSASLLEDSRFWRAVSLARADQRKPAIAALREFLRQHPTAARAGEVTAILGWQLLRDGQIEEAQRCFVDAQKDAHPQIRENARSGLAAVAARR
jgi:TolA-binding protein